MHMANMFEKDDPAVLDIMYILECTNLEIENIQLDSSIEVRDVVLKMAKDRCWLFLYWLSYGWLKKDRNLTQ